MIGRPVPSIASVEGSGTAAAMAYSRPSPSARKETIPGIEGKNLTIPPET
jgi:hypothetical protein